MQSNYDGSFLNHFFPHKRPYQGLPTTSDSVYDYVKPLPSIYPPAPLDESVKAAFPNRHPATSFSTAHQPSVWPYRLWNTFLIALGLFGTIFPVIVFYRNPTSPRWFDYAFIVVTAGPFMLSLPMWVLFFLYSRPPSVIPAPPITEETTVAVDILVTTYNEDLDEVAGTLAAVQNLIWHGTVNVYILDDGKREDIADLCAGMKTCKFRVTRVVRQGNVGKKAGNLNNFLKVMPRTADFFVILDCDMRPFPNMLNLLFGAYFDPKSENERDRIGFITTPQYFRNYNPDSDPFDILCTIWINVAATEDATTGCIVHTTENGNGKKYISKYVPLPVASGLSPRTLAELMDQHCRWNVGMAQMTAHFNFFLFYKGLKPIQRYAYFVTMAGFLRHIPTFIIVWFGTIFFNIASAYIFKSGETFRMETITVIASMCSMILPTFSWLLLPGPSMRCNLRGIQMAFVYTPTEIAGLMAMLGFKVPVKFASESNQAKWHPFFYFHIIVYGSILSSTIFTIIHCASIGIVTWVPYIQTILMLLFWTFILSPIAFGIFGHQDREDEKWMSLEKGRETLFRKPVWSEMDNITFEQLKNTVEKLYQRVEQQETELKILRGECSSPLSLLQNN